MITRLFAATLAMFAWLAASPAMVSAQPYDGGHARVELISERAAAVPGETVYLALHKQLDEDWHVYWRNAGDAGLPPQILWDASPLGSVTQDDDFTWPLPHELVVVEGEIMDYGYDNRGHTALRIRGPAGCERQDRVFRHGRLSHLQGCLHSRDSAGLVQSEHRG